LPEELRVIVRVGSFEPDGHDVLQRCAEAMLPAVRAHARCRRANRDGDLVDQGPGVERGLGLQVRRKARGHAVPDRIVPDDGEVRRKQIVERQRTLRCI